MSPYIWLWALLAFMAICAIFGGKDLRESKALERECARQGGQPLKDMNGNTFCVINGRLTIIEIKE